MADPRHSGFDHTALGSRNRWVLAVVLAACWVPLVVAAVALARTGWTPVGEFAQAELRVRDFWAHPPSLGAVGRLRTDTDVSSHPGPAAWWAIYPLYALAGRSAVGLSSAVAVVAGGWITTAVVLAWRRGGDQLAFLVGLGVVVLMAGFGPSVFLEPWNPWFAVMAFLALLVSVWAVMVGSRWALVVVAAAATWCVQAHVGFAPPCAALVLAAVVGAWQIGPRSDGNWRRWMWPILTAIGVTGVMWLPPLYEQLTGDPGNFGIMLAAYRAESGAAGELGVAGAIELVVAYLDPRVSWMLLDDPDPSARGASVGSVLTLLAWAASAVVAVSLRSATGMRQVVRLHVVVAVSLFGSLVAAARIPGEVFGYLLVWLAVSAVVVWVAILWTAWLALRDRLRQRAGWSEQADPPARWARLGLVSILVLASAATAVSFSDPDPPGGYLSDAAAELVKQTTASLASIENVAEDAISGTYLLRWEDPANFGALGTAVLSELEREGIDVGVDERLSTEMRPHRVIPQANADDAIWVVSGEGIEQWRSLDAAVEIAFVDPRSAEQRAEQEALAEEITRDLDAAGAGELAEELPRNAWTVRSAPQAGAELDALIDDYVELGFPTAIFLAPTDAMQPAPG